jgi:hypothetical protein
MYIRLQFNLDPTTLPSEQLKALIAILRTYVIQNPDDTNALVNLKLCEEDYHSRITEIIDVSGLEQK